MTSAAASLSRHLLAGLVLAGFAAVSAAADPPPTASPPTPDRDLVTKLGDLRRDAFRHPPATPADAVTSRFAHAFRQLGLFPGSAGVGQVVSREDCDHLRAVASRTAAVRREVLHALDDWLFLLEQSDGDDTRSRPTLALLRDCAAGLEADEPNGLPLGRVRAAVAARDADALAALFDGEAAGSDHLLRHTPGRLFAQVHTVLSRRFDRVASQALRTFARLRPADPAVNALLVKASRTPAQASRFAYALLLTDPDSPAYHTVLGQTLLAAAVRPNGGPLPAARNFRDDYDAEGVGEALDHLEQAVRLNADQKRLDPAAHHLLGVAYEYSAEWWKGPAVAAFEAAAREAALAADPPHDAAVYHLALAQALQNLGRDPNRVVREAERCITLVTARPQPPVVPGTPRPGADRPVRDSGPDELAQAHVVVGRAHLDLGRADDAVTQLTTAARLRPKSAPAWFWLGKAYFAGGDTRRAVEAARRAHELDQTDPEILSALGEYALADGEPGPAAEWFARAAGQARKSSPFSAWQPGRLLSPDEGVKQAEELAAHQRVMTDPAARNAAEPTAALVRAAAAGKHYSVAARTFQTLRAEPGFEDPTGELTRLAVGAAVRAGRDGRLGDRDRTPGGGGFHALARRWADEELGRVRAHLEELAQGKGGLDREGLLDRLRGFQTDPVLAAVREPRLRAGLVAAERRSWETFWDAWNETLLSVRGLPSLAPPTVGGGLGGGLGGF